MSKLLYNFVLITCLVTGVVSFECKNSQFECNDGSCINNENVCDGHPDCPDRSDEFKCDLKLCKAPEWYKCADKVTCISSKFLCDNEDNCPDGDDEMNCGSMVRRQKPCSKYEFTCRDKSCIPLDFSCDGKSDCSDGSDETFGCANAEASCLGFVCVNKRCLESHTWVCDGIDDCGDGSDESGCAWNCKFEEEKFLCKDNDTCITLDRVCDGKADCGDKSDENGLCSKNNCETKNCPPASTCHNLPTGPVCLCPKGFEYNENKHICQDINECEIFGICSQGCVNTIGSYNCICANKFKLNSDNKTCEAHGGEPLLLYTTQKSVVGIYLKSHLMYKVADNLTQVIGVGYDGDHIYWTNIQHEYESIVKAREDGSEQEQLLTSGLDAPEDLAVDWMTGNIYFSDNVIKHIAVCSNSGHYCTTLIVVDVDQPRGIALNPLKGLLFWTDWGVKPMIGRASMDGSNAKPIVTTNIHWPNGVALDIPNDRLYWVDAKLGSIESARMDGSNRKIILGDILKHPYGIALFEDNIYWSDWGTKSIHTCHKFTGKSHEIIAKDRTIYAVHIYHPALQPKVKNPCDSRGCSHFCLLAENNGSTCACPEGMNLALDQTRCIKSYKKQRLFLGIKNYLIEMEHTSFGRHKIAQGHPLPMFIHRMAYNNINGSIFIADNLQKIIYEYEPLKNKIKTLVSGNLGNITALSFDHLAQNLYWSDSERHTVEVLSLRNRQRAIVHFFSGLEIPVAMTVIPDTGKMFVALHSVIHLHIDQRDMNGQDNHYHVFENFHGLGDIELKVDYDSNTLYWIDTQAGRIDFTNMNRMEQFPFRTRLLKPVSMAIVDEDLFWSIQDSSVIYWTHKSNLASIKKIEIETPKESYHSGIPQRISLLSSTPVLSVDHKCLHRNGGCSHVCVSIGKLNSCLCPPGLVFSDMTNRTCIEDLDCEFRCKSGECLTLSRKCNGHVDCSDGSDENNCDTKVNEKIICKYDEFACRDGTECFPNEARCDQVADCKDKSDEDNCEKFDHTKRCHIHQFACNNGRCVDLTTLCDEVDDCGDKSDEKNCSSSDGNGKKDSCGENMYKCTIGSCISKSWECDGKLDCPDGSDEHEKCGSLKCANGFQKCKLGKCIDSKLICDGHDDCGDNSDEINCEESKRKIICGDELDTFGDPKKFQCSSEPTMCLDVKVRCNGTAECPKGEDEQGCSGCSIYEFQCKTSKECIRLEFRCDKEKDCVDGSDELNCEKYNSSTHHLFSTSCQPGTFDCKDGTCIDSTRVCNGISDCDNGEDELSFCKTACKNSPCDHKCTPSPYGSVCSCNVGYKLASNKRTCIDIDECIESHACSQICENTIGSYRCTCFVDFMLRPDKTTCKSMDSNHYVLFNTLNQLRKISENPVTVEVMMSLNDSKITGMDVNVWKNLSYFTLEDSDKLYAYDLENKKLVKSMPVEGLNQISVDWISDNVYGISHIRNHFIKVCNMKTAQCAQIVKFKRYEIVKALVVDPINRYLFYAVVNSPLGSPKSTIYISGMDGSKQNVLLQKVAFIVALQVDIYKKELYFIDRHSKTIQVVGFKNENNLSRVVIRKSNIIMNPSGFSIFENSAYVVNTGSREAVKCELFGNSACEAFDVNVYNAENIVIAAKSRQKMYSNECDKNKCSVICIRAELGPKCICQNGKLSQENLKCENTDDSSDVGAFSDLSTDTLHQNEERSVGTIAAICLISFGVVSLAIFGYLFYQRKRSRGNFNVNMHFQNPLGQTGQNSINGQFNEGKVSMGKPLQRNLPTGSQGSEIILEAKGPSKNSLSKFEGRESRICYDYSDSESTGDVGSYNDNPKAPLVF